MLIIFRVNHIIIKFGREGCHHPIPHACSTAGSRDPLESSWMCRFMLSHLPWPSPRLWDSIWAWWQYFLRPTIIYHLGSGIARRSLENYFWRLLGTCEKGHEHFHDGAGESGPESWPSVCSHSLPSMGITQCGRLSPRHPVIPNTLQF